MYTHLHLMHHRGLQYFGSFFSNNTCLLNDFFNEIYVNMTSKAFSQDELRNCKHSQISVIHGVEGPSGFGGAGKGRSSISKFQRENFQRDNEEDPISEFTR